MAKALDTSDLSEMEHAVLEHARRGVSLNVACELAGYSNPTYAASRLRYSAKFQSALAAAVRRFLYSEAAPAAINLMYEFMVDEKIEPKLRLACAKTIADRAGFIAPKAKDASSLENKSLVDMTADEMREMASRIQKELSERAVVVIDHAPQQDHQPSQAIDMFD